jgi:uncharacterized membrane protein
MPAWLHTGEPRPGALFSYLFLLEAGLVSVSIRRGWWWIAALNLLASFAWAAIWIAGVTHGILPVAHGLWVGLFLVASMTTFSIASGFARPTAHPATLAWSVDRALPTLAVVGGLVLLGFLSAATKFSTREWGFIAIVGTSLLVLARLDRRKEVLAVLGALSGAILLAVWHLRGVPPADETRFAWVALAFGILYAGGSYVAISGSARRSFWAGISALAALAYFLVAYWDMERLPGPISWGTAAFLASSLYTLGALPFARRLELRPELRAPLAALTVAATAFITLAVPMELERQWITVAWALEVAALAWFEARLAARAIRVVIAILAAFVAVRLLINPAVLVYPVGTSPILNWILYGYGIPLAAFVLAARILRHRGEDALVRGLECCAIALGFVLIALLVRQYFHPGKLRASSVYLAEWATLVSIWTLYARQLSVLNGEGNRPSLRMGSLGVGIIAGVLGFLVLIFFENPLWARHPVGARLIWNGVLFAYGVPLACTFLYLQELKRTKLKPVAILFAVHGIIFLFVLSSLEVRQAFHGSILAGPVPTNAEWYAYSLAWIALGTLLLVWGVVTGSHPARYASLVVMLLAVGKVFLFDTRELRDLYRVLSFLGLGLSLLFLAYTYQRFVFRRHER